MLILYFEDDEKREGSQTFDENKKMENFFRIIE